MTAKEKAKELMSKFSLMVNGDRISFKRHALLAVDELLNEYPVNCPKDSYEMERYLFWNEVKQEIEKL